MKNIPTKRRKPIAGSPIIESLREAVDWAEGKDVSVHVTTVEVPTVDVRAVRRRLGLVRQHSQQNLGSSLPPCGTGSRVGRDRTDRRASCSL